MQRDQQSDISLDSDDEQIVDDGGDKTKKTAGTAKLTNKEVHSRLVQKLYSIEPPANVTSDIWKTFGLVLDDKSQPLPFCACRNCLNIYSYKSQGNSGTSTLTRHKAKCDQKLKRPPNQKSILPFASSSKKAPRSAKEELTKSLVKFCCKDLRPFEAVAGEGLKGLVDASMKIGSVYGVLDVNELVPEPITVKRNTVTAATSNRGVLVPKLKESLFTFGGGVTFDMWTEQHSSKHFLAETLHWVDDHWVLRERVLEANQYKDEKADGKGIRAAFYDTFSRHSFSGKEVRDKLTAVTDCGSNMISAVGPNHGPPLKWLPCSCHRLNTVLSTIFDPSSPKFLDVPLPDEHSTTIDNCKQLVTYFKRSGFNQYLEHKLVQEVSTRWFSTREMLKSVQISFDEANQVLRERKPSKLNLITVIDRELVDELITFLTPFCSAIGELEAGHTPTLHLVAPWYHKLESKHLKITGDDNDRIVALKERGLAVLHDKFWLKPEHYMAVVLDPNRRKLRPKNCPANNRESVIKELVMEMQKIKLPSTGNRCDEDKDLAPPPKKRSRTSQSSLADMDDTDEEEDDDESLPKPNPERRELTRYMDGILPEMSDDTELLQFWKSVSHLFPKLSIVARRLLAIPASSSASERTFSATKLVYGDLRTSLKPDTADSIIFMNSHFKAGHDI